MKGNMRFNIAMGVMVCRWLALANLLLHLDAGDQLWNEAVEQGLGDEICQGLRVFYIFNASSINREDNPWTDAQAT